MLGSKSWRWPLRRARSASGVHLVVARSITSRLERVSAASGRLAAGDLGERAPEGGPSEIAELAASFNAMADHLEEIFDARSQLVAWASHDLRAPVTSLQAMLEAIEDGVVEPGHYLEALQGQVRSARRAGGGPLRAGQYRRWHLP